jgi:predicted enzyme related to lactoylglutathione lyase
MDVVGALTRMYVPADRLDAAVDFYAKLFAAEPRSRFSMPGLGVTICAVGSVLVVAGSEETLAPLRPSVLTLVVKSLEGAEDWLEERGATVVRPRQAVPTGFNLVAEHPDGARVEYVELRNPRRPPPEGVGRPT